MEGHVEFPGRDNATPNYSPISAGNIDGSVGTMHDRAVNRALKSFYKYPRIMRHFKRYFPGSISQLDLKDRILFFSAKEGLATNQDLFKNRILSYFEGNPTLPQCKDCPLIKLIRHPVTKAYLGYGFLKFHEALDAKHLLREYRSQVRYKKRDDRRTLIIIERPFGLFLPAWKPRRLGGGIGGRKESGQLRFGGIARLFQRTQFNDRRNPRMHGKR